MPLDCRRGQIWLVNFDPQIGHEITKERPALILSVDELNRSPAGIVVVVPGTSAPLVNPKSGKLILGYCEVQSSPVNRLDSTTYFVAQQIKTCSSQRLIKQIGILESAHRKRICDCVANILGLYDDLPS